MFPKPEVRSQRSRRRKQEREYSRLRKDHLKAYPRCGVCTHPGASEIHHKAGREGDLLTDTSEFMSVHPPCHRWIHANPAAARKRGWLKSRNQVAT